MMEELIARAVAARFDALEAACEEALLSGKHGVLVDGDKFTVDGRVPYGHIYDITKVIDAHDVVGWR